MDAILVLLPKYLWTQGIHGPRVKPISQLLLWSTELLSWAQETQGQWDQQVLSSSLAQRIGSSTAYNRCTRTASVISSAARSPLLLCLLCSLKGHRIRPLLSNMELRCMDHREPQALEKQQRKARQYLNSPHLLQDRASKELNCHKSPPGGFCQPGDCCLLSQDRSLEVDTTLRHTVTSDHASRLSF